ncbi:MAG: hypothetical protein PVF58_00435 [Candidatus Methanofastidiosia archaeon]|jgi:hypothetical protein
MVNPYKYIRCLEAKLKKHALSKWIREAEKDEDPNVRIIAYNILLEIKYENISEKNKEKLIINLINHLHKMRKYYSKKKLYDQIIGFVNGDNSTNERIFCCGNNITTDPGLKLGRIMKWELVSKGLKENGDNYCDGLLPNDKLEAQNILYDWKKSGQLLKISGSAPLFWIFKKDEVKKCTEDGKRCNVDSECAEKTSCNCNSVCKRLGLTCSNGSLVFQVEFSLDSLDGDLRTPTVFDSKFEPAFRSCTGTWGRTINMENLCDELDEAIHEEHPWPDEFEVTRLGYISEDLELSLEKRRTFSKKLKEEVWEGFSFGCKIKELFWNVFSRWKS